VLAMMCGGIRASQSDVQAPALQKKSAQSAIPTKKKRAFSKKKTAEKAAPAQQLPAQTLPPIPATLMNSAPVKPRVTMEGGLLTIDAPNSTLNDVLNGVRKATGATIEGIFPNERVAVKLGPGVPRQVLEALLRGTPYDYVILGSPGNQDAVTRILLRQPSSQPPAETGQPAPDSSRDTGVAVRRPETREPQSQGEESLPERTPPDEMAQPTMDNSPQPEPEQTQPPEQRQPAQTQQEQPKTPEQLFKELQQLGQPKQQLR